MENVTGLLDDHHSGHLAEIETAFAEAGFLPGRLFSPPQTVRTAQMRERLFLVGYNKVGTHINA